MAPIDNLLNSTNVPEVGQNDQSFNKENYNYQTSAGSSPLSAAGQRSSSSSSSSDDDTVQMHPCKWKDCSLEFTSAEILYHHLCQDHVGRKSQKNLQLNCQWDQCHTKTVKRDHITSHLRVHVPLKPFSCSTCSKKFKRPQDLKKHLKVHNEELSLLKKKRGPKPYNKVGKMASGDSVNRNYAHQKFTLPSISLEKFIHDEVKTQPPVYSQQLAEKMAFVPLMRSNSINTVNNNSNQNSNTSNSPSSPALSPASSVAVSPSSLPQHNPAGYHVQPPSTVGHGTDLRYAVGFFNNLSMDMSRNYSNKLPHPAFVGGTPVSAPQSYPVIPKLPSISSTLNVGPPAPMLPVFNRFDTYHSLASSTSSAFHPHSYSNSYSLQQKSSLHEASSVSAKQVDALQDSLKSLDLSDKKKEEDAAANDDEDDLFALTYSTVNLLKDYLLCELMEELDEFSELKQDSQSLDDFINLEQEASSLDGKAYSDKLSLSRYPQVVV